MEYTEKLKINGQYYSDVIPDTFDLAERAALALTGAYNVIDPKMHYWMWFSIIYDMQTPALVHNMSDVDCAPKLLDAMTMARYMTGDVENEAYEDVYQGFLNGVLRYQEDDGIFWSARVEKDRPWAAIYDFNPKDYSTRQSEDIAHLCMTAKMEQTFLTLYQVDGDPNWLRLAEKSQEALDKLTIRKEDYAYHPVHNGSKIPCGLKREGWSNQEEPMSCVEEHEGTVMDNLGFFLRTPVMMYRQTGSTLSRDLADRWAKLLRKPRYWGKTPVVTKNFLECAEEPVAIAGAEQGHWYLHDHSSMRALRALLDYGIVMHDSTAVEFAKRAFDFSWSMGIPKLGWIVEAPGRNDEMEACSIGDLIAYAIRLCDAGAGDYWDQADSLIRNALAQAQYTQPEQMAKISASSACREYTAAREGNRVYEGKDVIDKTVGIFLSNVLPDGGKTDSIMMCCHINCMQGLFYAYEGAVREEPDTAHVNLLFNRASKGLDVYSYLPYEGKVVVRNKGKKNVFVRIPGWVNTDTVLLKVDDCRQEIRYAGRYVIVDGLAGTEKIEITFEVPEYTASYTANIRTPYEKKYTIRFRGSNAVDISPRDESPVLYPFYTDSDMRSATSVPMKEVTRFVPENELKLW